MAQSIYECLRQHGEIAPQKLALSLGKNFDRRRSYGNAMRGLLHMYALEQPWTTAEALFDGQGSYGSGAAARVAPLGAYFADDLDKVVEQARLSAIVTHTHPEAIAATIAVAVAAAYAVQHQRTRPELSDFLRMILVHVPNSLVKEGIERSLTFPEMPQKDWSESHISNVRYWIGHERRSRPPVCIDVPYALWCAAHFLTDVRSALGYGPIVSAIVVAHMGDADVQPLHREWSEPMPFWVQKP
jgi:hypothetical protein